ncbi:MAG: hypothetical protein KC418_11060, partial [Anaerolineales bacterium]|nr:hypothetical protein [Anaerolineales bacterium]
FNCGQPLMVALHLTMEGVIPVAGGDDTHFLGAVLGAYAPKTAPSHEFLCIMFHEGVKADL